MRCRNSETLRQNNAKVENNDMLFRNNEISVELRNKQQDVKYIKYHDAKEPQ